MFHVKRPYLQSVIKGAFHVFSVMDDFLAALVAMSQHEEDENHAQRVEPYRKKLHGIINRLEKQGRADTLCDLALAGYQRARTSEISIGQLDDILSHIEHVLATTPRPAFVHALFRLFSIPRENLKSPVYWVRPLEGHIREAAWKLAARQPELVLCDAITRYRHNPVHHELLCCLVQEMVLRQMPCVSDPMITEFWQEMRAQKHALAWLPLHLFPMEDNLSIPHFFKDGGYGGHGWGGDEYNVLSDPGPQAMLSPGVYITEVTRLDRQERVLAPFASEFYFVDDGIEIRFYTTSAPLQDEHVADVLLHHLHLNCLHVEETATDDIPLDKAPFSLNKAPFRLIYRTIIMCTPLIMPPWVGAYPRLLTWRAIAALSGLDGEQSIETVYKHASNAHWYWFYGSTPWFRMSLFDMGILVLSPDRRALAVLAATNTD